ncbi:MAG: hypothetical protein J6R47_03570 [Acholeplasmatales bacterium]|nr:hypothetical protein [Acholeplasmatales bacterium]
MPVNIYVDIGKASGNIEGTRTNLLDNEELSKEENPQSIINKNKSSTLAAASMIAVGGFNYVTSNIGSLTGNQQNQATINKISTMAQSTAMFFLNPIMASANVGMQLATTAIDENIRRSKDSVALAQARARAGYTEDNAANYRRR